MPSPGYTIFLRPEQNVNVNRLICGILKWIRTVLESLRGPSLELRRPILPLIAGFTRRVPCRHCGGMFVDRPPL
jgi:hypothetical protein